MWRILSCFKYHPNINKRLPFFPSLNIILSLSYLISSFVFIKHSSIDWNVSLKIDHIHNKFCAYKGRRVEQWLETAASLLQHPEECPFTHLWNFKCESETFPSIDFPVEELRPLFPSDHTVALIESSRGCRNGRKPKEPVQVWRVFR